LYVCIAAPISPQNSSAINQSSRGVNVSLTQSNDLEIQRLSGEVGKARKKSDSWDTTTNLVLLVAAVVAVGIAIAAIGSSRAKSRLIGLQDDVATAKEAHLLMVLSTNEGETARLKELAEKEHLARVKLEASVAWRRLTKDQISDLGTALEVFPRQLTALVYNVNDIEAYSFATDVDVALHEFAKWNIAEPQAVLSMREGPVNFGTNPPLERGVVVNSTPDERSRAAAKAVVDKLSSFGFDAVIGAPIPKETPTVQVFVQPRPEGPQGAAKLRSKGKDTP
jgi:hypothetical protein